MSNILKSLYELIDRGRKGLNIGTSTGLPKLDKVITGIQKQTFYLISGDTGSGKTTFCLYSYIYAPLKEFLGTDKFKVVYYSLEMTAEMLLAKLMSMYIYDTYGVVISYSSIFSREEILSDAYFEYVEASREWIEKVLKHLVIYDKSLSSKGLYAHLSSYAEANGTFVENPNGISTTYVPKIADQLVLVVIDHVWLMRPVTGQTKKDMVDEAAEFLVTFRNKCGYSPVAIQQLNRTGLGMDRRKEGMQLPELQDLKGTGGVAEAAEIVIALFNPARQKMNNWEGYDIKKLKDRIRGICILKNRFGEVDKVIPTNFFGEINIFRELPKPEEMADNGYGPYCSPRQVSDIQVDKVEKDTKIGYEFVL